MNIKGNTLFLGDSMSVALAPAVSVDGTKRTIAQVSKTSAWLKSQVTPADFQGVDNVFLLIGANDIGQANPGITLSNIAAIRAMAPPSVKFFVMTIPPFKGWKNYESQYSTINARRLKSTRASVQRTEPAWSIWINCSRHRPTPKLLQALRTAGTTCIHVRSRLPPQSNRP